MRTATISDELTFDSLSIEMQETIRRLARSGYLGTPLHVHELIEDAQERGYEDGFEDGRDEAKSKLENELEQILCGKCYVAVSDAL